VVENVRISEKKKGTEITRGYTWQEMCVGIQVSVIVHEVAGYLTDTP